MCNRVDGRLCPSWEDWLAVEIYRSKWQSDNVQMTIDNLELDRLRTCSCAHDPVLLCPGGRYTGASKAKLERVNKTQSTDIDEITFL
jgi:hypothetical protein